MDQITNFTKFIKDRFWLPLSLRRVGKRPAHNLRSPRKDRTWFFGVITNRDHIVKSLSLEFMDGLGTLAGNIYADLSHDFNGKGIDNRWLCPPAENLKPSASIMAQYSLRHLRTARISRT